MEDEFLKLNDLLLQRQKSIFAFNVDYEGENVFIVYYNLEYREFFELMIKTQKGSKLNHVLSQLFFRSSFEESISPQNSIVLRETVPFSFDNIDFEFCGTGSMNFHLDGQSITKASLDKGYESKNLEKFLVGKDCFDVDDVIYRLNPLLFIPYNNLYYRSLESLFKITPSDRAISIRMISEEITRMLNHLKSLSLILNEVGVYYQSQKLKEHFYLLRGLLKKLLPNDQFYKFSQVGGVWQDISLDWRVIAERSFKVVSKELEDLKRYTFKNFDFQAILQRKEINRKEALDFSLTGPSLRATGVNFDLRLHNPYDFYGQVDFDIPLGHYGSSFDRVLVRVKEIEESINIIEQLVDNISSGPITSIESVDFSLTDKCNSSFFAIESSEGALGLKLEIDENQRIDDIRYIIPTEKNESFICYYLSSIPINEAMAHFYSMNIHFSELDK